MTPREKRRRAAAERDQWIALAAAISHFGGKLPRETLLGGCDCERCKLAVNGWHCGLCLWIEAVQESEDILEDVAEDMQRRQRAHVPRHVTTTEGHWWPVEEWRPRVRFCYRMARLAHEEAA